MYPLDTKSKNKNDEADENIAPTQYSLISVSTMCPAVMLAASRNDSVIGRTRILVVSIITRNGFSHSGAPSGRKCATDFLGEYANDEIIILSHIGSPIDSVRIKCLEDDSEYGIIPIRLMPIIVTNNAVTIEDIPFRLIDSVRESCVIITLINGNATILFRCLYFHICGWIITRSTMFSIIARVVDGKSKVKFLGSKIEKMSLIIKIWFHYHLKLWRLLVLFNLKSYFSHLSHSFDVIGFMMKNVKYSTVATWPIIM